MSRVRQNISSQSPVSMRQIYGTVPMFSRRNAGIAHHAALFLPFQLLPSVRAPRRLGCLSPLDHGNTAPLESVDLSQQLAVVCVLLGREG